ncbi:tap domain-containing protein [Diplodia corticola]|uniref:Tap domain-containing protein n=1 Tax=Diplodia corticola TaxID=236234 RepID=A0A1J9QS06_9PEZI|nr:tap domain-containing protein [Diplodia corticola]OJD30778.1 tap domain-containing protein [Diplodia corticola]
MFPKTSGYLPFLLFQATAILAEPRTPYPSTNQTQGIQWSPCGFEIETLPMLCGSLSVPLDYLASNSTEMLELKLAKAVATKSPSRGSILFNFGGPGSGGRAELSSVAAQMNAYTGGYHDLIAFDPRGTVDTIPFSCFGDDTEKLLWQLTNRLIAGNASDTALGDLWAISKSYADTCQNNTNATGIGGVIGTAYTARDLISVVDALGEDGLLRFWGFSYGSPLGATVAAMFPERVDRVIIDGVLNIHQYWHYHDTEMWEGTDRTFSAFLEACVEAGDKCALNRPNATASSLEDGFYAWLEDVKYHPISLPDYSIDYSALRGSVVGALYNPRVYSDLAELIDGMMTGNVTDPGWQTMVLGLTSTEARIGILCGDKATRSSRMEETLPAIDEQMRLSRLGGDVFSSTVMQCARWQMDAKERYLGDFNVQTRTPILTIGNTYDPVTPFASALNASKSFPGAVALEHHGFGHASIAQASICTVKAVQAYFLNGTLPEPGTVCEVDQPLFSNVTWKDVIPTDLV